MAGQDAHSTETVEMRAKLQAVELRCAMLIGNGRALTAGMADELYALRDTVGASWDATNHQWLDWERSV